MAWPSLLHQFDLIIPQKIETTAGAKVKIRGGHFQLRRLPRGRPQQGSRRQRTWAEDLRWLLNRLLQRWVLIRKRLCGGKICLWRLLILLKACERQWEQPLCINVISFCPTSQTPAAATLADVFAQAQRIYFQEFSKHISECSTDVFLQGFLIHDMRSSTPESQEQCKNGNRWYKLFNSKFFSLYSVHFPFDCDISIYFWLCVSVWKGCLYLFSR